MGGGNRTFMISRWDCSCDVLFVVVVTTLTAFLFECQVGNELILFFLVGCYCQ